MQFSQKNASICVLTKRRGKSLCMYTSSIREVYFQLNSIHALKSFHNMLNHLKASLLDKQQLTHSQTQHSIRPNNPLNEFPNHKSLGWLAPKKIILHKVSIYYICTKQHLKAFILRNSTILTPSSPINPKNKKSGPWILRTKLIYYLNHR